MERNPILDSRVDEAVFFPRPDLPFSPPAPGSRDHFFEASDGARLRLRVFDGPDGSPAILFFHGNGETARDYDGAAADFAAIPARLLVAEYRGYGPCTGSPSMASLADDAHDCFDAALELLGDSASRPPLAVMGRSLGSAPAIELASSRGDELAALAVESGFASTVPLLELLGVPVRELGIGEEHGPRNADKIARVQIPTLVMHAEQDRIIPVEDGELLRDSAGDPQAGFLRVPGAGHNDIMLVASERYFSALAELLKRAAR
ncbi:MAG: alpha/beta hydrolase [Polyangia bacterium]